MSEIIRIPPKFFLPHKPCNGCPFTWNSVRGWFGPYHPQEYLNAALGEGVIACHNTTKACDPMKVRHCTGAALFRSVIVKMPRREEQAAHQRKCVEKYGTAGVFNIEQFREHHLGPGAMLLLKEDDDDA